MGYIIPNGKIQLFKDLGLSPSYDDTLYFPSTLAKDVYFDTLVDKFITEVKPVSYTRVERGYVRIEKPMSLVYNANYMRFQNTAFEGKWFYAFVKSVDYINNGCVQVNFEIDYIMTWMGEFELKECFVERQHTLNDGIGNNICEEGLPVGEYINELEYPMVNSTLNRIVVVVANTEEVGSMYGAIYSGCNVEIFDSKSEADDYIQELVEANLSDNIVGMYMIPQVIESAKNAGYGEQAFHKDFHLPKPYDGIGGTYGADLSLIPPSVDISYKDGYTPRNKKLYTYPYKYMVLDNGQGATQEFLYEYFNTLPPTTSTGDWNLRMYASVGASAEMAMVAKNYKNHSSSSEQNNYNFIERLGVTTFPQCAWLIDSYQAYRAQVNADLPLDQAMGGVNGFLSGWQSGSGGIPVLGSVLGGIMGSAVGTLAPVSQAHAVNSVRPTRPTITRGSQSVDTMFTTGEWGYRVVYKSITKNYAIMLDDYFDMFGYAVKERQVPNMNARPHWTFVKTIGCIVHGEIPSDDAKEIENIFDKGVRFWHNISELGNYNLDNSPR